MKDIKEYDVIVVGGSYSGLAAGMALGRSLRKVLIIDSADSCNKQAPHSHNLLTHDGEEPSAIAAHAKEQVKRYKTVEFYKGLASFGRRNGNGFEIQVESGETFAAQKLIFATGIKDIMPEIPGFAESWGISVLHCPYCHGYEARNLKTGILGNGEAGFSFSVLISNWTKDLSLYTNGKSTLTDDQYLKLEQHQIQVIESEILRIEHRNGRIEKIIFKDGRQASIKALYAPGAFVQHSRIPEQLGCELNDEGYIRVDPGQKTTIPGVFACGDNTTRMRTLANAIAMGTTAGMMANKEFIEQNF